MVDIQYLKIGWDVFKALKAIRDALTDGQRTKDDLGSWIQLFQAIEAAVAFSPSSRTEESMPPRTVAVSVAVAAFAETWNDWWAGSSDAAPLPSRKRFGKLSQLVFGTTTRERQFAFAIRSALSEIAKSPESDDHPLFVGDPAASASYRALWKALVDEDLELVRIALSLDGELHEKLEPLMPEGAGDKHRFESAFRYSFRLLAQRLEKGSRRTRKSWVPPNKPLSERPPSRRCLIGRTKSSFQSSSNNPVASPSASSTLSPRRLRSTLGPAKRTTLAEVS